MGTNYELMRVRIKEIEKKTLKNVESSDTDICFGNYLIVCHSGDNINTRFIGAGSWGFL